MYSQTFHQILIAVGRCRHFRVSSAQFSEVYQTSNALVNNIKSSVMMKEGRKKKAVVTFAWKE
jgi:hypothetical protein